MPHNMITLINGHIVRQSYHFRIIINLWYVYCYIYHSLFPVKPLFFEFHLLFLEACLHLETCSNTWLMSFTSVYPELDLAYSVYSNHVLSKGAKQHKIKKQQNEDIAKLLLYKLIFILTFHYKHPSISWQVSHIFQFLLP